MEGRHIPWSADALSSRLHNRMPRLYQGASRDGALESECPKSLALADTVITRGSCTENFIPGFWKLEVMCCDYGSTLAVITYSLLYIALRSVLLQGSCMMHVAVGYRNLELFIFTVVVRHVIHYYSGLYKNKMKLRPISFGFSLKPVRSPFCYDVKPCDHPVSVLQFVAKLLLISYLNLV